jgi:hypothetical protein
MKNYYLCPQCRGHLRVGENIVFKVRNPLREKGLLLLHPEVGNYSSLRHPNFHIDEGDRIDFFCPLCMSSLDASLSGNKVHVIMVDPHGKEHEIFFSRIAGEDITHQVFTEGVKATSVHSYRYTHFKESDKHSTHLQN